MTKLIPVKTIDDLRGLHLEEFSINKPLSADSLAELMATEASLYEYLSNKAVLGNSEATVEGHSHGRKDLDGEYIKREGVFYVGHLFEHSSTSLSYETVLWEIFNTGGPNVNGVEQAGSRICLATPAIYLHSDYKKLVFNVLLKADSPAIATAKLSLLKDDQTIAYAEQSTTSSMYEPTELSIAIDNSEQFTGWINLKLELKSSSESSAAYLVSDDIRFKPLSGTILNGNGLLLGE